MSDINVLFEVTEEEIKKLKAEHPEAKFYQIDNTLDDGRTCSALFRRPSEASIQRYRENAEGGKTAGGALAFVMDNIVVPTKEEFFKFHKELPFLDAGLANELVKGLGIIKDSKKKEV